MARRMRQWRAWGFLFGVSVAAACGGDKATAPAPCDTYTGGILSGNSGDLPGSYALRSYCQGEKPDVPGGSGNVAITATNFTASIGAVSYSGTYTTSGLDGITVTLTSPLPATFLGTFRLRNDSLAVSGTVGGQRLSLVGTRQ